MNVVIHHQNVSTVDNCMHSGWLLTIETHKFTVKTPIIFHISYANSLKISKFHFTVPPAVSTLPQRTSTIAENLECTIDMSNLMLKYIPPDTLFYRNMALMQKTLIFTLALNKGSYGYNSFGHKILVDDFFEREGTEPPRKRARVIKSEPLAIGKKLPTAT